MVFIDKAQGCVFVWSGLRISKTCITLTWLLLVSGEHIYVTVSVNRLNFTHPETNIIFKINEYKSIYHLFLFSSPEEKNYAIFIHQAISEFPKPLTFSTRLSAKPFMCKWVVFAWESKIIFMSELNFALRTSLWNRGLGELGNGLIFSYLLMYLFQEFC